MLNEKILQVSEPSLKNLIVTDIVVGISLIAVKLDNDGVGVSYVLREELPGGCSVFPYGREIVGKSAWDAASWFVTGNDSLQKSIGNAVLNAASDGMKLPDCDGPETPFGLELKGGETVGMVGMIPPAMMMLNPFHCKFIVFDKGKEDAVCYPAERQEELLPQCDVVFLSGTTTINGTADELLSMCSEDAQVVMIGSSTPMYPKAFTKSPVRILAGSCWKSEEKDKLFSLISMASGMDALRGLYVKKNVRVR